MTSNGLQKASQNGSTTQPHLSDLIASLMRRRFKRIKTTNPDSESFPAKPHSKSVFDHAYLYPSYWKLVFVIVIVYLAAGTLCFHLLRNQISGKKTNSVLDALYFTILTMTSVGYGDLVPATKLVMLFGYLFVISGMLIVGLVLSKAADLLVEKQEQLLVNALSMNKINSELEMRNKNKIQKVRNKCIIWVVLLVVLMAAGTGLLLAVEDLNFVHAFYCVIGTLTGLGYIDKCFSTAGGRAFALIWILFGTICVAELLFTFASLHTKRRQRSFIQRVLKKKITVYDLEAAEFDGDGIVMAAEFVIYKLKEMGKISHDDIKPIMDEFEKLDIDETGTLSASDLSRSRA